MSFSLQNITMTGGMSYTVPQLTGSIQTIGTTQAISTTGTTSGPLDLATGAGNWTVECWFYLNSVTGQQAIFWKGGTTGSVNPSYCLFINGTSSQWIVGDGGGGGYVQNMTTVFAIGSWYHFALVRNGSTITAYVNGVAQTPITITTAIGNTSNNNFSISNSTADGSSRPLNGYVSNFRIVKGVAVYTSAFTPPTNPLTATQSANTNGNPSTAITGTSTSLLLNTTNNANFLVDSSTFNTTMTNTGSATSAALNPYGPGSILFNGTSQWLTAGAAANWTFLSNGLSDWTIEGWVYFTSTPAVAGSQSMCGTNIVTANIGFGIQLRATDMSLQIVNGTNGTYAMNGSSSTITWAANTWYHVAVTYTSSTATARYYVNGVSYGSSVATAARSASAPTNTLQIGRTPVSTFFYLTGYISNLRVVKDVIVYTGGFIPPTTPLTPVTNTQLLVNVASSGTYLTDSSTNNFTLTPTGTVTYNASTPVSSGGSLLFDQTTISYLTVPSSATAFNLTGDFTIQAWINMTTLLAGSNGIIDARVNGGSAAAWLFHINGLGQASFFTGTSYSGATTISTGVWTHVAVVRTGSKLIIYVNGAADYVNASFGTGAISPGTTSALIGTKDFGVNAQYRTINYITNLQFVNGTALYTQTSFTPPPGPLSITQNTNDNGNGARAITGTQTNFLMTTQNGPAAFNDASTNAYNITNNGTATGQALSPFSF